MKYALLSCLALAAFFLSLACARSLQPTPAYPHGAGFITVGDSRLYYETTGAGPALLLLHGALLDHRMWAQQVAVLAKDHRVITCDQRGHGLTVDGDSSYFMHVAVRMLLDSLHVKRAVIAGLSMGAIAATDFAIEYPAYTEKLILLVPGLSGGWHVLPEDSVMQARFAGMEEALEQRKDTLLAAEYFIRNWYDGPLRRPEETDTLQRRRALRMAYENLRTHQYKYWPRAAEPKSATRLDKITCPTLLIVSEKDNPIIGRIARSMLDKIPKSKLVTVEGVAHLPNLERPGEVNRIITAFLQE